MYPPFLVGALTDWANKKDASKVGSALAAARRYSTFDVTGRSLLDFEFKVAPEATDPEVPETKDSDAPPWHGHLHQPP